MKTNAILVSLALLLSAAAAAPCSQSNGRKITEACQCRVSGGSKVECAAGRYCYNYHMGCHSSAGEKTCAMSDSTIMCPTGKTIAGANLCNGDCTVDKCCTAATCTKSDTNPLSADCHCASGNGYEDPRGDGHCSKGKYCWGEHGYSYCTDNRKDSYSEKTCGDGFRGVNGVVGSSTCPSTFAKRSDEHKGRNMDFRQCCYVDCKTRFSNCNKIDPSMSVANSWIMPINTAGDVGFFGVGQCCYRTQCTDWKKSGNMCPAGKVLKNSNDHHECDGTCDASECCQDPPECGKDHLLHQECYCGSATNLCKKDQYCWTDGSVCKDEKNENKCATTDGSVVPWGAATLNYKQCACGDNEKTKGCSEGSTCDIEAVVPCTCTPSATQVCHYSKKGDITEITAAKFGCVSHGEDEKDGEKKNVYEKISCSAEGTNVRAEKFTDDKCTVVATGAFMENSVFTGKDVTQTKMEDSKTVTKVETTQYIISTCNGGAAGTLNSTLNSGVTTTFSLATIAAASIAIAALL